MDRDQELHRGETARDTIRSHALYLFTDYGYDAVGVQAICSAAGITKPTLYHYFGSKRGLLSSIIDTHRLALFERTGELFRYSGDLSLDLTRLTHVFLSYAESSPRPMQLLLSLRHAPRRSESWRAAESFLRDILGRLEELFERAAGDHGNMNGRARPYAVSFLATLFGYIDLVLHDEIDLTGNLPHRIMHQFSYGIYS